MTGGIVVVKGDSTVKVGVWSGEVADMALLYRAQSGFVGILSWTGVSGPGLVVIAGMFMWLRGAVGGKRGRDGGGAPRECMGDEREGGSCIFMSISLGGSSFTLFVSNGSSCSACGTVASVCSGVEERLFTFGFVSGTSSCWRLSTEPREGGRDGLGLGRRGSGFVSCS